MRLYVAANGMGPMNKGSIVVAVLQRSESECLELRYKLSTLLYFLAVYLNLVLAENSFTLDDVVCEADIDVLLKNSSDCHFTLTLSHQVHVTGGVSRQPDALQQKLIRYT